MVDSAKPNIVPPGVLAPPPAGCWSLERLDPCHQLASYISWFWFVEWDLRDNGPHQQATLGHPCVQLVVEQDEMLVYGPASQRFTRELTGYGRVVGVRFQAAGFWPFVRSPLVDLTDEVVSARKLLDMAPSAKELEQFSEPSVAMAALEQATLRCLDRLPEVEPRHLKVINEVNAIVELIASTPALSSVEDLAGVAGRSVRSLQRDFARFVGLAPKAVIRRYRLQEAASVALNKPSVDWAELAERLGYYDHAHFVGDFTATIGYPPATYARNYQAQGY